MLVNQNLKNIDLMNFENILTFPNYTLKHGAICHPKLPSRACNKLKPFAELQI